MKVKIAIFFSILFVSLLATPTIISLTDYSQEIAFFLDINEEEENKGKEESKIDSELKIHSSTFITSFLSNDSQMNKNIRFHSKNYVSEYLKITTPPPKFML
ncbi:hypothetical protein [uncultured Polaribacter sp.]|uniref:hypothetical protein n=1 Tax=uncultured Polaribacter sp. TaxID=174711 RepID=UPI002629163D|nr:hypothetical protein [uncultured Polaribacter sp.]